ncbi:MAG: hypothetical protein ACSHX8_01345 [Opitutaceae bacterium]
MNTLISKNIISLITLSLVLPLLVACSGAKRESVVELENGDRYQISAIGSSLYILHEQKPVVHLWKNGNLSYIETFANGVRSLEARYEEGDFQPRSMNLSIGYPDSSKLIMYDSDGEITRRVDVHELLSENKKNIEGVIDRDE